MTCYFNWFMCVWSRDLLHC